MLTGPETSHHDGDVDWQNAAPQHELEIARVAEGDHRDTGHDTARVNGVRRADLPPAPSDRGHSGTGCHVGLLDGFELRQGGQVVPLPLSTQRVVAFLALHDRPLLRVYVAGQLWPDVPERRSAASLRSALWRLGRPREAVVVATAEHVSLAADVIVDAAEVQRTARRLFDPAPYPRAESLQVAMFAGVLLPDWYDDWVLIMREQVRHWCLHGLERLADVFLELGDHARALDAALEAVRLEPLRESAHRITARIHLAEGNHGEALRRFHAYRAIVRSELGLEPSAQFSALLAVGDIPVTSP
jgi:DNA-binding SARP family transcriptional activator